MFTVNEPKSEKDFLDYYTLRYNILRKPWGHPIGSEKDKYENSSVHACVKNENSEIVSVCRLQMNNEIEAQVRYMAVDSNYQGKGLGKKIMLYMEDRAREKGAEYVVLHARENALEFYKSCGYHVIEKSYLLWEQIQHYLMKKSL